MCPGNTDIEFLGAFQTLKTKFLTLSIEKCTPQNQQGKFDCADDINIEEWMANHTIVSI